VNLQHPARRHRPGAAAAVLALVVTLGAPLPVAWLAPQGGIGPAPVLAADGDPTPAPTPSSEPQPTDTPAPTPEATIAPSDPPSEPPAPTPAPTPDPAPTADPGAPLPSSTPEPTPVPTPIAWDLSGGQQEGRNVGQPFPLYRLVTKSALADVSLVHTPAGIEGPDCAACHSAHRAEGASLVNASPDPRSTLCYRCHAGQGSDYDVQAQVNAGPANDPANAAYYRHVIETGSAREASCEDCHNPHEATAVRPQMSTTGWTASGDVRAASGVGVTNGSAGTAPAYALISRAVGGGSLTYEYELCLKCHSGNASLPSRSTSHPSWWALDKGVELNPANAAYHPVEASGRNRSTQMAASLAGSSPFKAWDFPLEATIRCSACHGDPSTVDQTATATPKRPSPAAREASHGSPNRGILTAPYRDRLLKGAGEAYDADDFGLCYLCHAERPFVDPNEDPQAPDTAFSLHGLHLVNLPGRPGAGTSIDAAGAGEGLAICSECHFRIHSTALAYKPGDTEPVARSTGYGGLVAFAPNVVGLGANAPAWTAPGAGGTGSCALTCHGYTHLASATQYGTAPGTGFSAAPTSGPVGGSGLLVAFTDATRYVSGAGATWSWTFGDGGVSTLQNPTHVYVAAGTYTVTLTVTRTSGGLSATMTRSDYIIVNP
jgi:predicted CXXCH cytochrome family protein